ncbi:MAG: type I-E CRISPR-associated endoribonuclease Cas2 [Armatimonadetes bacterium]|nr:type I-E CRISPR-associated endoribonuclease Cas2 [Armatimonadota bacterium]
MVILILERASPSLRGELTRWLIEPRAGVFVGVMSGLVRDRLWEKVCDEAGEEAAAVLIHSGKTEQGFRVRTHGERTRELVDVEGLTLVRVPSRALRPQRGTRPPGEEEKS